MKALSFELRAEGPACLRCPDCGHEQDVDPNGPFVRQLQEAAEAHSCPRVIPGPRPHRSDSPAT